MTGRLSWLWFFCVACRGSSEPMTKEFNQQQTSRPSPNSGPSPRPEWTPGLVCINRGIIFNRVKRLLLLLFRDMPTALASLLFYAIVTVAIRQPVEQSLNWVGNCWFLYPTIIDYQPSWIIIAVTIPNHQDQSSTIVNRSELIKHQPIWLNVETNEARLTSAGYP